METSIDTNRTHFKEDGNNPQVTVNYYWWPLTDIPWQSEEGNLNSSVAFNLTTKLGIYIHLQRSTFP